MKHTSVVHYFGSLFLSAGLLATSAIADDGGALYTMDNAAGANHVLVFHRAEAGGLTPAGSFATRRLRFGSGLSSQGAELLSRAIVGCLYATPAAAKSRY